MEEAMKKVMEAQQLIDTAIEPGMDNVSSIYRHAQWMVFFKKFYFEVWMQKTWSVTCIALNCIYDYSNNYNQSYYKYTAAVNLCIYMYSVFL